MSNIPKIIHFFWDASRLSYLQYLTIVSFHKFNPDWEIIIHECEEPQEEMTWDTNEQKLRYSGKDYYPNLKQLEYVKINKINFKEIGFSEDVSDVYKSDYVRWYMLSTMGGVWSDMDILYFKPMTEIKMPDDVKTVICSGDLKHLIGFLMASPNNEFFKLLTNKTNFHFDPYDYQSIGSKLINFYENNINDVAFNLDYKIVYPFNHSLTNKIFYDTDLSLITDETIGVHWFNGCNLAKEFTNDFTEESEINNVITLLINKYNILK